MKIEVHTDTPKNILYMKFVGFHKGDDGQIDLAEVRKELVHLRPGFAVINDISEFVIGDEDSFHLLKEGMALLREAGCRRVIRVGSSSLGRLQFHRASNQVGYSADTATSVAEAEAMLAEEARSQG